VGIFVPIILGSLLPIMTVFAFRCTAEEQAAIFEFARQLELPASQVARHYLLQAAAQYNAQQTEEGADAA
jgi:hypothetical protein